MRKRAEDLNAIPRLLSEIQEMKVEITNMENELTEELRDPAELLNLEGCLIQPHEDQARILQDLNKLLVTLKNLSL